MDFDLFQPEF